MKACRYFPERRCFRESCSIYDCKSGLVFVCPLHPNKSGFFTPKKVRSDLCVSVLLRRS